MSAWRAAELRSERSWRGTRPEDGPTRGAGRRGAPRRRRLRAESSSGEHGGEDGGEGQADGDCEPEEDEVEPVAVDGRSPPNWEDARGRERSGDEQQSQTDEDKVDEQEQVRRLRSAGNRNRPRGSNVARRLQGGDGFRWPHGLGPVLLL